MSQTLTTRRTALAATVLIALPLFIATVPAEAKTPAPQATTQPAPAQPSAASPAATPPSAATTAGPKVEKQDSFYVIGMTVKTNSDAEVKGDGPIVVLWQRFLAEGGTNSIPGKVDEDVYAVYSDYKADQSFTYTLGSRVTSIDHVPAGMVAITVPAGRYAVVTSATGPLQEVVPALWQKVWTMSPAELGGKHSMKVDYNIFNLQGIDPQNSQVDGYVGLQ